MKTLTFYQFLDIIEKTHCTRYTVRRENGATVFYLGCYLTLNNMLVVYKSRPFKLDLKVNEVIATLKKHGITFLDAEFLRFH